MDDADKTENNAGIINRSQLQQSRRDTGNALAIGECLFCEALLPPGLRWCGPECRDDWQKENQ